MDKQKNIPSQISIVMSGLISEAKHANVSRFKKIRDIFVKADIKILAPHSTDTVNDKNGFIEFQAEKAHVTPLQHEEEFLRNINRADFLYVVNTSGHIQYRSAIEMKHAFEQKKPIVTEYPKIHFMFSTEQKLQKEISLIPFFSFNPDLLDETEGEHILRIQRSFINIQNAYSAFTQPKKDS